MTRKIYRWIEYNKWSFISGIIGLCIMAWITSCSPANHTDVQMRTFKTDTTDTNESQH